MNCQEIVRQLGPYVDGELVPERNASVEQHVQSCPGCARELRALRRLTEPLSTMEEQPPPSYLWDAIAARLTGDPRAAVIVGARRSIRWAVAAVVLGAVGLGVLALSLTETRVQASVLDFSMLLDGVQLDAEQAFARFLKTYQAQRCTPQRAVARTPQLNFALPETLPGGFQRGQVYLLRFGSAAGVAAAYHREGQFLAAIFHPPVQEESFGTHRDYDCVVGKHRGHKVQVGSWKLVHLTDPTTCHCVLSTLDEDLELPAIMDAVAPRSLPGPSGHAH